MAPTAGIKSGNGEIEYIERSLEARKGRMWSDVLDQRR